MKSFSSERGLNGKIGAQYYVAVLGHIGAWILIFK